MNHVIPHQQRDTQPLTHSCSSDECRLLPLPDTDLSFQTPYMNSLTPILCNMISYRLSYTAMLYTVSEQKVCMCYSTTAGVTVFQKKKWYVYFFICRHEKPFSE